MGTGESRFDLEEIAVEGGSGLGVADADQEQVGAGIELCTVVIRYPDVESVRQLLQFGDHIEVLAPETARTRIGQLAQALVEKHSVPVS